MQPNFPIIPILLVLCVWGAFKDRSYKNAGGQKPTKYEKNGLLITIVGSVALLVVLGLLGSRAEALGELAALLIVAVFGFWELNRLRIRRSHPVARFLR